MNAEKSEVMVFVRKEAEMVDFSNTYRVNVPGTEMCEVYLGGERMEEVKEFKYLE